jgi:hypothetical protein
VAETVQADADVIGDSLTAKGGFTIKTREDNGSTKVYNFSQYRSRREWVAVAHFVEEAIHGIGF